MSFLYPLGLLGLLGVPVLILIYIIKNKYAEQTISSTYIWTLSEKFLKRRNPINKVAGIISLILQILAVVLISVAIARPVFYINGAANDFCFILDGTGSMSMQSGDTTRFGKGKEQISEKINSSAEGCTYSLVYVGDSTTVIYENVTDKKQALKLLDDLKPSYADTDFNYAQQVAQEYFDDNPSVKTYLYTDKNYDENLNVQVVDLSDGENNYAIGEVTYQHNAASSHLSVNGTVFSYSEDKTLEVKLYLNGEEQAAATISVETITSEAAAFTCELDGVEELKSLRAEITDGDDFMLDNEVILYNEEYENGFNVLIVSETETFLEAAISSFSKVKPVEDGGIVCVTPEEYSTVTDTFDLYVYQSYSPAVLPTGGAVIFVNPVSNVNNSNFTIQSEVEGDEGDTVGTLLERTAKNTEESRKLLNGYINSAEMRVNGYVRCNAGRFCELLTADNAPVVFAGKNAYDNPQLVFAFDLSETNVAMLPNFVILLHNWLNASFPDVIESTLYSCGDALTVNTVANCTGLEVTTPSGKVDTLDFIGTVNDYILSEVGTYSVRMQTGDGERVLRVYSALPESESLTSVNGGAFNVYGEASNKSRNGTFSEIWFWFIILAAVVAADWAVYCYEQYQLR